MPELTNGVVRYDYEQLQKFNAIVAWLHSLRYRHVISRFAAIHSDLKRAVTITDVGCAHAKLYSLLNDHIPISYTGIEANEHLAGLALSRYGSNDNFRVIFESAVSALDRVGQPDVVVALETLEHIPEADAVRIVEKIASMRPHRFIASFPIEIGPAIWFKNVGSLLCQYERHKEYTWAETFWAGLYQLDRLRPHITGHRAFDWRWLVQTIRHNFRIVELRRFPLNFMPAAAGTSIFLVAEPR